MTRDLQWLAHAQTVSAAAAVNSSLTGPSGVKMTGPYSWVTPPAARMSGAGPPPQSQIPKPLEP